MGGDLPIRARPQPIRMKCEAAKVTTMLGAMLPEGRTDSFKVLARQPFVSPVEGR